MTKFDFYLQGITGPPSEDSFAEMICNLCFDKHKDFLAAYRGLSVTKIESLDNTKAGDFLFKSVTPEISLPTWGEISIKRSLTKRPTQQRLLNIERQ